MCGREGILIVFFSPLESHIPVCFLFIPFPTLWYVYTVFPLTYGLVFGDSELS